MPSRRNANKERKITTPSKFAASVASKKSEKAVKVASEEIKELKSRLAKAEQEIVILHELLKVQDYNSNNTMMADGHQWFGDVFLYELHCQYRGNRPKQGHWFNSIHSFHLFDDFANSLFSRKRFHHSVVLSFGYSDLFGSKPLTGAYFKNKLNALLNYIAEHGAVTIKVLSLPPSRQMMTNEQYLRICQTTNRFLKTIISTHHYVEFINLDRFFIRNDDNEFGYFDEDAISAHISDNLLMRKVNDKFEIFIEPATAQKVMKSIISNEPHLHVINNEYQQNDYDSYNDSPVCSHHVHEPKKYKKAIGSMEFTTCNVQHYSGSSPATCSRMEVTNYSMADLKYDGDSHRDVSALRQSSLETRLNASMVEELTPNILFIQS